MDETMLNVKREVNQWSREPELTETEYQDPGWLNSGVEDLAIMKLSLLGLG